MGLHPTLDLLMTGGRDSVCRVWDMRSKVQAHVLSGHEDTVCSILSQGSDPQASHLSMGQNADAMSLRLQKQTHSNVSSHAASVWS